MLFSADLQDKAASAGDRLPKGEIIEAIYCPRCGNTFSSQSDMVIHLRKHLIDNINEAKKGQRGRGRPRKNPRTCRC